MKSEHPPQLLVVDDDRDHAEVLGITLSRRGTQVITVHTVEDALKQVQSRMFDAVILDLRLGRSSGLNLIEPLLALQPQLRILLLTGYASIATAVEAIKLGATHYLPKPACADAILAALGFNTVAQQTPAEEGLLTVNRLEWEHIQHILAAHNGNISATARALKMHRRTLQRKLSKRPSPG